MAAMQSESTQPDRAEASCGRLCENDGAVVTSVTCARCCDIVTGNLFDLASRLTISSIERGFANRGPQFNALIQEMNMK